MKMSYHSSRIIQIQQGLSGPSSVIADNGGAWYAHKIHLGHIVRITLLNEAVVSDVHVESLPDGFGHLDESSDLLKILCPILFNATTHIDA